MVNDVLIYCLVFLIVLLLTHKGNNAPRYLVWSFIILFVMSFIRFDIGNDYDGYAYAATNYGKACANNSVLKVFLKEKGDIELSFLFFSKLFSWSEYPIFWIDGVYSGICLFFLYKTLKEVENCFWGMFAFLVLGFLFISWDGIRQAVAIFILIYSYIPLQNCKYIKFLCLLMLAVLFHHSAAYMVIMLPLRFCRINNIGLILISFLFLLVFWSGIADNFIETASMYLQYAGGKYEELSNSMVLNEQFESFFYKLRTTMMCLFALFIALNLPREKSLLKLFIVVGFSLNMLAGGSLTFSRIAWYFMVFVIIALPISVDNIKRTLFSRVIFTFFIICFVFLFCRDLVTGNNTRGCVPYETVFSEEFELKKYRPD